MKSFKKLWIGFLILGFIGFYESAFANDYCFNQASSKYGVPVKLLYAIAKVESDFNPYAINVNVDGRSVKEYYPKTKEEAKVVLNYLITHGYNFDVGIAQINVVNIQRWGLNPYSLLNPCYNLDVSARLLRELIQRYSLSWRAIWHYNGRPSYAYKVYHALMWLNNKNYMANIYPQSP